MGDILDTAVTDDFSYATTRRQYMRPGHGFLLVYSVTSRQSFDSISLFREQILTVKDEDTVPMLLVGNKCDLDNFREVATSEGEELAQILNCPFRETSAK